MMSGVPAMKLLVSDLNGLFAVNKPTGLTSAGVVNKLKKIIMVEERNRHRLDEHRSYFIDEGDAKLPNPKIGHGGTLDMNASGVLVIGIGRGTKLLSSMLKGNKRYRAIGCLGSSTDTQDALGRVTHQSPLDHVTQDMIVSSLQQFVGNTMQIPPLFSALKIGGVRMSDLAIRGEDVRPKPARPVTVHSLKCVKFSPPYLTLDIHCGGGFYVRQLIHDLGQDLGTCAHLAELSRTQQGPFTLSNHALAEDRWTPQHIREAVEGFNQTLELAKTSGPPGTLDMP